MIKLLAGWTLMALAGFLGGGRWDWLGNTGLTVAGNLMLFFAGLELVVSGSPPGLPRYRGGSRLRISARERPYLRGGNSSRLF